MTKETTRIIKLKNDKLKGYLKDNKDLSEEINKIVEEWKKTDEYVKKLSTKMERIKEKIRPLVAKELKKETKLEEFDTVSSTKLNGDDVEVEILDQIEFYKDHLRKQKDEHNNSKKETGGDKDAGESEETKKED